MSSNEPPASMFGCFLRMIWKLMGPGLALVMLMFVFLQGGGWFGLADAAFSIFAAACLAARWLDDPTEKPSRGTYVLVGLSAATGLWLIVHLVKP